MGEVKVVKRFKVHVLKDKNTEGWMAGLVLAVHSNTRHYIRHMQGQCLVFLFPALDVPSGFPACFVGLQFYFSLILSGSFRVVGEQMTEQEKARGGVSSILEGKRE